MNQTEIDAHLRRWRQRQRQRAERSRQASAAAPNRCDLCGQAGEPLLEAVLGSPGGEKRFNLCTSCARGNAIKEIIAAGGWPELERRLRRGRQTR